MYNKNLEVITCNICQGSMPKLRLDLYGYKYCINCSTEKPKVAHSITYGSGEEIYTETHIVEGPTK